MNDPIDISTGFDRLKIRLSHSAPSMVQFLDIVSFITGNLVTLRHQHQAQPFLLELANAVSTNLRGLYVFGVDPDRLVEASQSLEWAALNVFDDATRAVYSKAAMRLRVLSLCSCSFVRDQKRFIEVLSYSANVTTADAEPPSFIKWARNQVQIVQPGWSEDFNHQISRHQSKLNLGSSEALFPALLSRNGDQQSGTEASPFIRKLSFRISSYSTTGDDLNVMVSNSDHSLSKSGLVNPIRSSRKLLVGWHSSSTANGYRGFFHLSDPEFGHAGKSAHLVLAALFVMDVERFSEQRTRHRFSKGVLVSGDIDDQGNVLEVDTDSIKPKVVSAFFSPISILVLPETQIHLARTFIQDLNGQYERRELTILGVESLSDLFADRRIVSKEIKSLPSHWATKTWNRRRVVTPILLLTTLLFWSLWIQFFSLDMHPHSAQLSPNSDGIIVANVEGETIAHIPIGSKTHTDIANDQKERSVTNISISDLNQDGYQDVVWIEGHNYFEASIPKSRDRLGWIIAISPLGI